MASRIFAWQLRWVRDQSDGCVTSRMDVRTTEWVCDQNSYQKYDFVESMFLGSRNIRQPFD